MIGDEYVMRQVVLERLKMALQRQMSVEMASVMPTVSLDRQMDCIVMDLRRQLLAHRLPPQGGRYVLQSPRHASWWDHLKATYRGRWWWPRFLSSVSYVDVPVVAHINIQSYWTFPQATIPPADALGAPIMWTSWGVDDGS